MNEKIVISSEEVLLEQVIQEIRETEPGSKERESAIETYKTLMEKINDVDKLQTDLFVKEQERKVSLKDIIGWTITGGGIVLGALNFIASLDLANKALNLEETGMIKTYSGRKWLGNFKGKIT